MAQHYHLVWLWSFLVCIVIIVYSAYAFIAGGLIYVCRCIIIIMLIICHVSQKQTHETDIHFWWPGTDYWVTVIIPIIGTHLYHVYMLTMYNYHALHVYYACIHCVYYVYVHVFAHVHVHVFAGVYMYMYFKWCFCAWHVYISMWIIMCIVLCIAAANDVILFSVSVWSVNGCFQCLASDTWMFVCGVLADYGCVSCLWMCLCLWMHSQCMRVHIWYVNVWPWLSCISIMPAWLVCA